MSSLTYKTQVSIPGAQLELRLDAQELALWASNLTYRYVLSLCLFLARLVPQIAAVATTTRNTVWSWLGTRFGADLNNVRVLVVLHRNRLQDRLITQPWVAVTTWLTHQHESIGMWLLQQISPQLALAEPSNKLTQ